MEVIYNNKKLSNNSFLKPSETKIKPKILFSNENNKLYTLIMYDPDAINGTFIHWFIININKNINNGQELLKYIGPSPPPKSGKHRYIFELYIQNKNIEDNIIERNFSLDLIKQNFNITNPIFKTQFISQNDIGGRKRTIKKIKKSLKNKTKRNY
jgi:phosphatidylethanolamine-binding protein (PEBP) family uncharacterized protein